MVTQRYFFPYEVATPPAQNTLSFGILAAAAQHTREALHNPSYRPEIAKDAFGWIFPEEG